MFSIEQTQSYTTFETCLKLFKGKHFNDIKYLLYYHYYFYIYIHFSYIENYYVIIIIVQIISTIININIVFKHISSFESDP